MYIYIYVYIYIESCSSDRNRWESIDVCIHTQIHTHVYLSMSIFKSISMYRVNPRNTSPHQDSAGTAPSGTPPPKQPPLPPQTRGTQYSAPTHSNGLCSSPKGGPGPRLELRHVDAGPPTKRTIIRYIDRDNPLMSPLLTAKYLETKTRRFLKFSRACSFYISRVKGGLCA